MTSTTGNIFAQTGLILSQEALGNQDLHSMVYSPHVKLMHQEVILVGKIHSHRFALMETFWLNTVLFGQVDTMC